MLIDRLVAEGVVTRDTITRLYSEAHAHLVSTYGKDSLEVQAVETVQKLREERLH